MGNTCCKKNPKKSEEVRTYFIELEKHIDKYKNMISTPEQAKAYISGKFKLYM